MRPKASNESPASGIPHSIAVGVGGSGGAGDHDSRRAMDALASGPGAAEVVGVRDDASHYFRTLPRFETAAPHYAFLNHLLAVGTGEGRRDGPVHTIEEIL
jgi:hypothetical protein